MHNSLSLDVPSPPKGPLNVEAQENTAILSWRPPVHTVDGETIKYTIQKRDARGR